MAADEDFKESVEERCFLRGSVYLISYDNIYDLL